MKGAVSLEATTDGFFLVSYDGDLIDSNSETLAVIKPLKGRIQLPSCGSWKLEHRKIKSTNARGRSMALSFHDHQDPLDRFQVSFPIIDGTGDNDGAVDDGKLFVMALQRALEERGANKIATGCLAQP